MAAEGLATLDAGRRGTVNDSATVLVITTACQLVTMYAHICSSMSRVPPDFLRCGEFLLRSGAAAQRFVMRQVQLGNMAAGELCSTLCAQVGAIDEWQAMAHATVLPDAAAILMPASAPPALLHQWLQCTLDSLRQLGPPAWKLGGSLCAAARQLCFALVCGR